MLLFNSGDIGSNPGPDDSFDSSDRSVAGSDNEPLPRTFDQYFSFVHYNVQSLLPKLDITESELSKFDVVGITETRPDETISDNDITLTYFKKSLQM